MADKLKLKGRKRCILLHLPQVYRSLLGSNGGLIPIRQECDSLPAASKALSTSSGARSEHKCYRLARHFYILKYTLHPAHDTTTQQDSGFSIASLHVRQRTVSTLALRETSEQYSLLLAFTDQTPPSRELPIPSDQSILFG